MTKKSSSSETKAHDGADAQSGKLVRTLTGHAINECNEAIHITADARDPDNGNAGHVYRLEVRPAEGQPGFVFDFSFQHGPIKEVGTNGITHEALIEVLIDRLEGFQSGGYACLENQQALDALQVAKSALRTRTKARVARGVEGTHEV